MAANRIRKRPQPRRRPAKKVTSPQGVGNPVSLIKLRRSSRLSKQVDRAVIDPLLTLGQESQQHKSNKRARAQSEDSADRPTPGKRRKVYLSNNQTTKAASVEHWSETGKWPGALFSMASQPKLPALHENNRFLARQGSASRKRSFNGSVVASSGDGTDGDRKQITAYQNNSYETLLQIKNFYMNPDEKGPEPASLEEIQSFFTMKNSVPHDNFFDQDRFEPWLEHVRNENEARFARDTAFVIVPSPLDLVLRKELKQKYLSEAVNVAWKAAVKVEGPQPQPDFSVGFEPSAFEPSQLSKIRPALGNIDQISPFKATFKMYFPFLACEIKSALGNLRVAERQNAHSMAVAVQGVAGLYQLAKRTQEIHRKILSISVAYNEDFIMLHAYYPVFHKHDLLNRSTNRDQSVVDDSFKIYRCQLAKIVLSLETRWSCYTFLKNFYQQWVPQHHENICKVLDSLDEASKTFPEMNNMGDGASFTTSNIDMLSLQSTANSQKEYEENVSVEASKGINLRQISTPETSYSAPAQGKSTATKQRKFRRRQQSEEA